MSDLPSPPALPSVSQTPRKPPGQRGGCYLRDCLLALVLLMLIGVLLGGSSWILFHEAQPFLSSDPAPLKITPGTEAAFAPTAAKLGEFAQGLAAGQKTTLRLSADDLNALLVHDPRLSRFRDHCVVSLTKGQAVLETSVAVTDTRDVPREQRMFFNARLYLDASYSSGDFAFLLSRLETLRGVPSSAWLTRSAKWYFNALSRGFNRDIHEHPETYGELSALSAQIRTAIIQDDQIVVTSVDHPKAAAVPDAAPIAGSAERN